MSSFHVDDASLRHGGYLVKTGSCLVKIRSSELEIRTNTTFPSNFLWCGTLVILRSSHDDFMKRFVTWLGFKEVLVI